MRRTWKASYEIKTASGALLGAGAFSMTGSGASQRLQLKNKCEVIRA
jgi:hypothetical protein